MKVWFRCVSFFFNGWFSGAKAVCFPGYTVHLQAAGKPWNPPRYSADGEVQQARCFCVVVKERNYHMESWTEYYKKWQPNHLEDSKKRTFDFCIFFWGFWGVDFIQAKNSWKKGVSSQIWCQWFCFHYFLGKTMKTMNSCLVGGLLRSTA